MRYLFLAFHPNDPQQILPFVPAVVSIVNYYNRNRIGVKNQPIHPKHYTNAEISPRTWHNINNQQRLPVLTVGYMSPNG